MKFSLVTLALAAAASAATSGLRANANIDFFISKAQAFGIPEKFTTVISELGKSLGDAKPDLAEQAECVAPIVGQQVNSLSCNGKGPLSVLCGGIDEVASKMMPKVTKCGVKESLANAVVEAAKEACKLGKEVVYNGKKPKSY